MKQLIDLTDIPNLNELVTLARQIKQNPLQNKHLGEGKTIGLLFFNASLRTRLSTQKAAQNLGLNCMVMNLNTEGWQIEFGDGAVMNQGKQEHIKEAAQVLSQYCDIIGLRTFATLSDKEADYAETVIQKFKQYATSPIVSLESATLHPLQSIADLITIEEQKTIEQPKIVLTWAPHPRALPQAVSNSFAAFAGEFYENVSICNPKGFDLAPEFTKNAKVYHNQEEALKDADFVYAKNWSSYENYGATTDAHKDWIITQEKLKPGAKFMHCLPIRRNVIATDAVLDSSASLVIEQANNRTFSAQAVLQSILNDK